MRRSLGEGCSDCNQTVQDLFDLRVWGMRRQIMMVLEVMGSGVMLDVDANAVDLIASGDENDDGGGGDENDKE